MEVGAHLPLVELDGGRRTLAELRGYADRAARLGYRFLCGNDHLQSAVRGSTGSRRSRRRSTRRGT